MTVLRIFDGKLMQAEDLLQRVELARLRVFQGNPDEACRPADIRRYLFDGNVGELMAVLIGCAVDEHNVLSSVSGGVVNLPPPGARNYLLRINLPGWFTRPEATVKCSGC